MVCAIMLDQSMMFHCMSTDKMTNYELRQCVSTEIMGVYSFNAKSILTVEL